jgi:dUTP pyrophosphatase
MKPYDDRGEIMVLLRNVMREGPPVVVSFGERIAQLVIVPYYSGSMFEVDHLDGTDRGSGGFGSTGV